MWAVWPVGVRVSLGALLKLGSVKQSGSDTSPTAEKPALTDTERAERLTALAERLRDPAGLDQDTLAQIEQLTGEER